MKKKTFIVHVMSWPEFKELYEKYTGIEVDIVRFANDDDYFIIKEIGKLKPKNRRDYYVRMSDDTRHAMNSFRLRMAREMGR